MGTGSTAIVPFRGVSFESVVVNPRLLPRRQLDFCTMVTDELAARKQLKLITLEIEQQCSQATLEDVFLEFAASQF